MRALVIGRFQPFHLGHLHVVREIAPKPKDYVIGIAASADHGTMTNPFTVVERREMIIRALEEAGIGPFEVVGIPDIHNPPKWVAHVISIVPDFDLVVAHNPETLDLFAKQGIPARYATPYRMDELSGTHIRNLMLEGGAWQELIPPAVSRYLESIDGPGQIRAIVEQDQG